MDTNEIVRDFVDRCEYRHLDPIEVLEVLNAQDWHEDDEYVTIPAFTVDEDED
jgi:hypothetical protein